MVVKIRMIGTFWDNPKLGHCYNLVYIRGKNLAECLGTEMTGEYYIYDNYEMLGSEKLTNYRMEGYINNQLEEQICKVDFTKVSKVGLFEVKKVYKSKYGNAIHGIPIFNENIIYDEQTDIWQKQLEDKIKNYSWNDYINEEINNFNKKNVKIS